jgi:Protein of unknown function (DUF1572)
MRASSTAEPLDMHLPEQDIGRQFLEEARTQLGQCHRKIRHCAEQLSDEQLWHRGGEQLNSIANLVLHLSGNIGQRFLSVIGGEADLRDRDAEFAARGSVSQSELLQRLDDVVLRADARLAALPSERLSEMRRYRMLRGDVEQNVMTVILQTLVHVGGHTQEIIALTRLQLGDAYRFMESGSPR